MTRSTGAGLMAAGLCLTLVAGGAPAATGEGPAAALPPLVERAMATGLSPGLAVAVIQGGQVLWVGGFGDADREAGRRVSPDTRFYIASTSKALTALASARRAGEGRLDLHAPLTRALPGAAYPAGISGDTIRVRDLLTHTHGIDGRGPVSLRVAFTGDYTHEELLRALGAHSPAKEGRAFRYSNLGYDLIGVLLAPEERGGWRAVVEETVTKPLGMQATTAHRSRVPEKLLAQPYETGPEGLQRVRLAKEDSNMGPAGGHFSTAADLARLVVAELNGGRVDDRQAIPFAVIAETQRTHAVQDRETAFTHRHGWGLGWDIGTYEGDTLLERSGGFAGYRSHVSFMPGRRLGVVVLSNGGQSGSLLVDAVAASLYDQLAGRPDAGERMAKRLAGAADQVARAREAMAADRAGRAARHQALPRPLESYAGTYVSAELGTLEILHGKGRLTARMGAAQSDVEVYDAGKEQLRVELFGGGDVLTMEAPEGGHRAERVRLKDMTFTRR